MGAVTDDRMNREQQLTALKDERAMSVKTQTQPPTTIILPRITPPLQRARSFTRHNFTLSDSLSPTPTQRAPAACHSKR